MPPTTSAADADPSARDVADAELTAKIREVHAESDGTYGSPRVTAELRHRGEACGRRRVAPPDAPRRAGGPRQEAVAHDDDPRPRRGAGPDLIQRQFGPCSEVDRRYVGDITYIATWEGWAYLATVIDLASRRVVGWALADHMRTELVTDALDDGVHHTASHQPGVIFHSDRGCQYTSIDYGNLARAHGVVLSVGRNGQCWDNAVAESFFATIKRELIDTRAWPTRAGLRPADLRLDRRLVQHPPPALHPRLPQPRRLREHHPPPHRRSAA